MPLDDREQQILQEIERQLYEEDPELANAVRNIDRRGLRRFGMRLPLFGVIVGAALLVLTFRQWLIVAFAGFVLLVVSMTLFIQGMRSRAVTQQVEDEGGERSFWPFGRT